RGGWRSWRSQTPHRRYRRERSRGRSGPASPRSSGDRAPSRVSPAAPPPEGDQGAQPHDQGGADRQERVDEDVALRKLRLLREPVERRLAEEQEERVETAQVAFRVRAVELGVFVAELSELLDPLLGDAGQLVAEAEPDRLGRARLRAGGPEAVVDPVVAEGALRRGAGIVVARSDADWTGGDEVPAGVADVLVDVASSELGPVDLAGRARVEP